MRTKTKAQFIAFLIMIMCVVIAMLLKIAELSKIYEYYINTFAIAGVLAFGSVIVKWLTPRTKRHSDTIEKEKDFEFIDLDNVTLEPIPAVTSTNF